MCYFRCVIVFVLFQEEDQQFRYIALELCEATLQEVTFYWFRLAFYLSSVSLLDAEVTKSLHASVKQVVCEKGILHFKVIVSSAKLNGVKPRVLQQHKQLNLVGYCIKSSRACCVLWNDILRLISVESAWGRQLYLSLACWMNLVTDDFSVSETGGSEDFFRALQKGVEPMSFWLLVQMLYR